MSLHDKLTNLDKYPMHMPGHKRNPKFGIEGSRVDVTEIEGFDNLHNPSGVIKETEEKLGKIYRCKHSHLLVNGSTVGLLAAIFALCDEGDTIIAAKNCHKSVYNACLMRRLHVVFIQPSWNTVDGYYSHLDGDTIRTTVKANPQAKAIVITSPTYEGNISNAIECGIPLLIDAAHGAHLGISYFPPYPKGDIVVSSLHKTLPALTQTAVCNVYNAEYENKVTAYLDMLQTTSPSYVLMNSVDLCCDYILSNVSDINRYYANLTKFRSEINLNNLELKYSDDPGKIIISTACTDINGVKLAEILSEKYAITTEMASINYIILMTSPGDDETAFHILKDALEDIDMSVNRRECVPIEQPACQSEWHAVPVENTVITDLDNAVGRISAEFVMAYPPDIPILMPNLKITAESVKYIKNAAKNGITLISDSKMIPNSILTKSES